MKIIVAFFSISLLSLFTGFAEFSQNIEYSNYEHITKSKNVGQPTPYLHDKDSTLMIYPILENDDMPGYRYIQDIKFVYKDLHYCSDRSKITIINKDTSFSTLSIQRMSCKISAVARFGDKEKKILSKIPTQEIVIENLVTDNIYHYKLQDTLYFIKSYKLEDYKGDVKRNTYVFKPTNGGHIGPKK